jgi:hypothetical protein
LVLRNTRASWLFCVGESCRGVISAQWLTDEAFVTAELS